MFMTMINEVEATEIVDRENLAVIYRVERLEAIPNKDRIELVHLIDCGYTAICEKGHKAGDLVMFVKFDTVLPRNELFAFMAETKYRVKAKAFTVRDENDVILNKIYSQGIVLPVKNVINFICEQDSIEFDQVADKIILMEGNDVTKLLGITKYIPPTDGMGNMVCKGDFPVQFVSKTDEPNLASKTKALAEIQGKRVYITKKIEGTSMTALWDTESDELMVCSRNNQVGESGNKLWMAANKYNLKEIMKANPDFVIQAECYGEGIQKNKLGIKGVEMAVFNVVNKNDRSMQGLEKLETFCFENHVPMVEVIMIIDDFQMTFAELQELADKQTYANGEACEGIVIRPVEPVKSYWLQGWWSVKVINRDYRL